MKLDISNFDEKALKDEPREPYVSLWKLRRITNELRDLRDESMKDEARIAELDSEFMSVVQNLVNQNETFLARVPLAQVKDLFNELSDRIGHLTKETPKPRILALLRFGIYLTSSNSVNEKVQNLKTLSDLLSSTDDLEIFAAGIELTTQIVQKRNIDKHDKACYIVNGPNLLRSREHHFSLMEIAEGKNKLGESLQDLDLIFEVETQPMSLNEKKSTNSIVIPRKEILESDLPSSALASQIATKYGKDSTSFYGKLEAKITWIRYLNRGGTRRDSLLSILNLLHIGGNFDENQDLVSLKSDLRHPEYGQYIMDTFIKESIELIGQSNDWKLVATTLQTIQKMLQKGPGIFSSLDLLIKPQNQRPEEGQSQQSFIVRCLEDIASVKVLEDGISVVKKVEAKVLNASVAESSQVQFYFLQALYHILNFIKRSYNRGNNFYQENINQVIPSLIKMIDPTNQVQSTLPYNYKVLSIVGQILKISSKPRIEEQFDLIKHVESRLTFEIDHLDSNLSVCSDFDEIPPVIDLKDRQFFTKMLLTSLTDLISFDQQGLGMSRKIQEGKALDYFIKVLDIFESEKYPLVEEFINRYIVLVSSIIADSPAITPTLIKNGILPHLLSTLSKRMPCCSDTVDMLIFSMNQMSIQEEGQKLVVSSNIVQNVMRKVMDNPIATLAMTILNDAMIFRSQLNNLIERNAEFKTIIGGSVAEYLIFIQEFANKQTQIYFSEFRKETPDKSKVLYSMKNSIVSQNQNVNYCIQMIHYISNLSNESAVMSRNSRDIMTVEVFNKIIQVYESLSSVPILSDFQQSFSKIFKTLVEYNNLPQNVTLFLDKVVEEINILKDLIGPSIYSADHFDFEEKKEENVKDLHDLNLPAKDGFLYKGEQILVRLGRAMAFIKAYTGLHSSTQHQIIQNQQILKVIKFAYYMIRAYRRNSVRTLSSLLQEMKDRPESEQASKLLGSLFKIYEGEEQYEAWKEIKGFLTQGVEKRQQEMQPQVINFKVLSDFLNKAAYGSLQMRHAQQKESFERNQKVIGKLVYKISKDVSKARLDAFDTTTSNEDLILNLYQLNVCLMEIDACLISGHLEGVGFYQFFKKGGVNNIISCFHWLAEKLNVIDKDYPQGVVCIFDECCYYVRQILNYLVVTKCSESGIQALLGFDLGTDFDSVKNLYQTFYYQICTNLLLVNQPDEKGLKLLLKLKNKRNSVLMDLVMSVFNLASKGFSTCPFLKEGLRNEREQGRRQRNQVNPANVQTLLDLGMGFTRAKIEQALIQCQDNINNAMTLLMEWQTAGDLGIEQAFDNQIDEGLSSDQSEKEDFSSLDLVSIGKQAVIKPKKVQKVTEDQFNEVLKKTQQEGFKWIVEAMKSSETINEKYKDELTQIMLNEKNDSQRKNMYAQVDELFIRDAQQLMSLIQQLFIKKEDQQMIDASGQDEKNLTIIMKNLRTEIALIQRLISNEKQYLKEAVLKSDVFNKSQQTLKQVLNTFDQSEQAKKSLENPSFNSLFQRLIFDFLNLLFTILQLSHLQINIYASSQQHVDACQKKMKIYQATVNSQDLLNALLKIIDKYCKTLEANQKPYLSKSIITLCGNIAFKALTSRGIDQEIKQDAICQMFEQASKQSQIFDKKLTQSLTIMYFESNKTLFFQMEKIAQKVLLFKYENEQKKAKAESDNYILSQTNFPSFLKYMQPLSSRDQEVFKQVLKENFDAKTTERYSKTINDKTFIALKELKFSELKKQVGKERAQLKTLIKSIDFSGNDKQLKTLSKISKKQLNSQISESQIKAIHQMLQSIVERTSLYMEEYQAYLSAQQQQQKLIKPEKLLAKNLSDEMAYIETLFKLALVYPSISAVIIQFKPASKRTFLNWFVRDFMTAQSILRSITHQKLPDQTKEEEKLYEVTFIPKQNSKTSEASIIKALNNLSGYNHFYNLHEQTIKHEIRTKLMLESLSLFSKTMKDKSLNKCLQRLQIINSLTVIHALICFDTSLFQKQQLVARENFFNSVRVAVLREASAKDSNMQPSLIKLLNELLAEFVDPTLESNSDIVGKSVAILKQLAQFINEQKRNEERSLEKEKAHDEEIKQDPVQADLPMAEQENNESSQSSEEIEDDNLQMLPRDEEDEDEEDNEGEEDDEYDAEEEDNAGGWDFINPDDEPDEDNIMIEEENGNDGNALMLRDDEEMFEDDYDSQEEELFGNDDGRRPGQRQFDIINNPPVVEREQGINRWGIHRRHQEVEQRRNPDLADVEIQVQRILASLRVAQNVEGNRPRPQLQNPGWAGAAPIDIQPRKSLVDQMYEGLQLIGEKELLDQVTQIREQLETELLKDQPSALSADSKEFQPRGVFSMQRVRERGIDDIEEIMIEYDPFGERLPHLFRGEGIDDIIRLNHPENFFRVQNPLNPLMPHAIIQDPFNPQGGFFGNIMGQRHPYVIEHAAPASDNALFLLYLRQQQHIAQASSETLGADLLKTMDVQFEEKKAEEKNEQIADLQKSFDESSLSNDQLLMNFFQRPSVSLSREQEEERPRLDERNRSLRDQISLQSADIQMLASQLRPQDQIQAQQDQVMQQPGSSQQNIQEQFSNINLQRSPSIQNDQEQPLQQEEQLIQQQQPQIIQQEEVKQESDVVQEEIKQPEQVEPLAQPDPSNQTFGYDNELLLAYGIDPTILHELPEELRIELLSSIDIPPQRQQSHQPPPQQQPAQQQQVNQSQEEQKQPEQQQQPSNASIADELGLDPEFLANLPEDMQLELIQNEQFRQRNLGQQQQQQQPQREAEQMDLASFIATVSDPNLRREIFANMDEATIQTLPANLMAEARNFQSSIRYERQRARDVIENIERRARGLMDEIDGRGRPFFGGYGHGRNELMHGMYGRGRREEGKDNNDQAKNLDDVICSRWKEIDDEQTYDDVISSLTTQLTSDERILEALLQILIYNEKTDCELIPCLQALIKVQTQGIPIFRNKVINAITYLLKTLSSNDKESLAIMFPFSNIDSKKTVLLLIGTLRIFLRNNRSLMKHILKGLILKEENFQHQKQSQILRKQLKAMKAKANASMQEVSAFEESQTPKKTQSLPPLAEIFYLIRSDLFKNDKALLRNLSMLIHQILKEFNIALEELEASKQSISTESVRSIAEVLFLDTIDQSLMQDLGEFLFQISKKKKENFDLISGYCQERSGSLVDLLREKLNTTVHVFNDIRNRISPGKMQIIEGSYSPSQDDQSVYEEEKNEMIIDTSIHPLQELQKQDLKSVFLKLPEEDEKLLKTHLRLQESSEILLRLFKLYNLFYEKFSSEKKLEEIDQTNPEAVIAFIHQMYQSENMTSFMKKVSDVLRIVYKTNLEVTESISNLIFCVLASYYPELYQSMVNEEAAKKQEEEKKQTTKYQIKMLPLNESIKRQEKFILFRNASFYNQRIEDLSNFCLANKRVINKLIKTKSAQFGGEFEGMFKYMPNLLDFENKRNYFKRELGKLKRNQYRDMIQLFIRRDNIFMDAYAQLAVKQPDEMQGKLQIQFTGERGQDAGGLTRDFFIELSREMFNPNYSLFVLSSSGSTYYPNPKSYVERDHLRYFKFIGRVIGKALFDECLLECYFVKSLYKIMTGEALLFQDLEDFDNEFFNNLKWCLQNDITPLYATFVAEQDFFGRAEDFELIENGRNTAVTNENKDQYIEKLTYFKLYQCIQKQIDAFLEGFYELIPKELISIFNYKELELLISGLPNFDINDLKQNTEYAGYNANSPQVLWLWEILESFENSERAEFLQFVTGSSKVPLDGFKGLMGMRGPQKFTIAKIKTDDILRLPSGHTCFNQIDMPEYPSKEIMHERLLTAIKETKGFGFA